MRAAPPIGTYRSCEGDFFFVTFFTLPITRSIVRDSLLIADRLRARAREDSRENRAYVIVATAPSASMATLKLGLAPKTIKYLMFAFNLLFVITGIVLLSIGVVIHGVYHEYQHFLDNSFFSVPSLLVALGSIIFIIAFFGCCGAIRESYCMVVTFCTLLAAILLLEVIGGTMGYVMRARVATVTQSKMVETMSKYNDSQEIQFVWDNLQRDFKCCGTVNATDWINQPNLSGIPMSCCDDTIGAVNATQCTLTSPSLHDVGCMDAFARFAEKHASKIAGVGLGLGVIQLLGIFLSSYLARSIRTCYQTM